MSLPVLDKTLKGAQFINSPSIAETVFTTEDFSDEQIMIRDTMREFIKNDFMPVSEKMEQGEHSHNRDLLKKLGDLGMLGAHMPESYGGLGLGTNSNTIITEEIGSTSAFSTTFGAHTGIGMLPILYYGTEAQKDKYLPELISGNKVSCYCLTEPGSGSDALAARTTAILSADGKHYLMNGQKMWISNAGFADVFIVFAKIDGREFTGFILERTMPGISFGAEEKKMGIKGSSTRQVFFENVKVPVENLLGEKGKGHHIAFNVLNTGRFKIGPSALGGTKGLTNMSIRYANERVQFGKKISSFGAIKSKIALQASKCFAVDAATYRTSGLINDCVKGLMESGQTYGQAKLEAAEEYALESSILKVGATDILNFVASECVQIHGGMGFSEEAGAARGFRDSRIAMIYEGTNEINRLLMLNLIFRRAMKGELDFATGAMAVQQEILAGFKINGHSKEKTEAETIVNLKKISLMLIGSLGQLAMKGKLDLKNEQEILMNVADILIQIFQAESALLRIQKHPSSAMANEKVRLACVQLYFVEATETIRLKAREAVSSFVLGHQQESYLRAIDHYVDYPLHNVKELKNIIADHLIERNAYSL